MYLSMWIIISVQLNKDRSISTRVYSENLYKFPFMWVDSLRIITQVYNIFIYFSFDPNPTKRINFWGVVFGNALTGASVYGHRQEGYQRYAAMPTISKANL